MEETLAIDFHDNIVTGVRVRSEQRMSVVTDYGVALVGNEGDPIEALVRVIQQAGGSEGECRVSIGAGALSFRNLSMPFTDRKKIAKVLPFELEELTMQNAGELQIDFLTQPHGPGTNVLAAMATKDLILQTLATLKGQKLDPSLIAIGGVQTAVILSEMTGEKTFVLLDISLNQTTLLFFDKGHLSLIRPFTIESLTLAGVSLNPESRELLIAEPKKISDLANQLALLTRQTLLSIGRSDVLDKGYTCFVDGVVGSDQDLLRLLKVQLPLDVQLCNVGNQPQLRIESLGKEKWNPSLMNRPLALALWHKKQGGILNLRTGELRKQPSLKKVRSLAVAVFIPLMVAIVGLTGFCAWELSALKARKEALNQEIYNVFSETLPGVKASKAPLRQLKVKVQETRELYRTGNQGRDNLRKLNLLAEISARVPPALPVRISRLVADGNDVRIKGETQDFNTVDSIKKELEQSGYFTSVVISSANLAPQSGEVRFELKLDL